jgi:hypothetical protein
MSSVREQIVQAAVALLNTAAPPGMPVFTRTRLEPYGAEELPAGTVRALREEIEYEKGGKWGPFRKRTFTLRASLFCLGHEGNLDDMVVWVTSQLDGQFTPLIEDCIEGLYDFQTALEDHPYCALALDFRVHYHTIVGDQTRAQ